MKRFGIPAMVLAAAALVLPAASFARDRDDHFRGDRGRHEFFEHRDHDRDWRFRPGFNVYVGPAPVERFAPVVPTNGYYDQYGVWHPYAAANGYYDQYGQWRAYGY